VDPSAVPLTNDLPKIRVADYNATREVVKGEIRGQGSGIRSPRAEKAKGEQEQEKDYE
jgi:hypothetical protein